MKRLFLLGFAAITVLAGGPAVAADIPMGVKAAPARIACAAQQWQGGYIGIHGGGVYHDANRLDSDGFLTDNSGWSFKKWGGHAGGQIGYNWANCNTFWGVVVDGSWVSVNNDFRDEPNNAGADNTITTRMDWLVTGRLRTGVALDSLLLYVTGGVAGAHFRTTWTDAPLTTEFAETRFGWVGGVGTEWAWTRNLSLKSEILYVSFTDRDNTATLGANTFSFRHSDAAWISRIGLNWRWGH